MRYLKTFQKCFQCLYVEVFTHRIHCQIAESWYRGLTLFRFTLIFGSSAFSKTSLNLWKFTVHVLLKPSLENFKHYFANMWDECNCAAVWAFFGIAFLWDWNENWPFSALSPLLSFPNYWHINCSTFTASAFRIWKSSTGIPSPSLGLIMPEPSKISTWPWIFKQITLEKTSQMGEDLGPWKKNRVQMRKVDKQGKVLQAKGTWIVLVRRWALRGCHYGWKWSINMRGGKVVLV